MNGSAGAGDTVGCGESSQTLGSSPQQLARLGPTDGTGFELLWPQVRSRFLYNVLLNGIRV